MNRSVMGFTAISLVCSGIIFAAQILSVEQQAIPTLNDLALVLQSNRQDEDSGCNAAYVYSIRDSIPIFSLADRDVDTIMTGMTSTTDFTNIFISSGSPDGLVLSSYQPYISRLRGDQADWNRWATEPSVTGGRFTYDRIISVMPDDETLLVEEYGAPGAEESQVGLAKYCLSEIASDGQLGPQRGLFPLGKSEFQIIPSRDGRHAHLVSPSTAKPSFTIDVTTMQSAEAPIPVSVDPPGRDAEPGNEYLGTISPDEKFIVTRRDNSKLAVMDLVARTSSLVSLDGLCSVPYSCGESSFNHASINAGLLAVRGTTELAVFEFSEGQLGKKVGRLPLAPPEPIFASVPPPLAWSGDGSRIIVATNRANGDEFLVVRVEDNGRKLVEERTLRSCADVRGLNHPRMILTANRHLSHVIPSIACVPPTPTPTATSTNSPTMTPTQIPTPSASSTVTVSPTSSATSTSSSTRIRATPTERPTPQPIYLPLLLREECKSEQRHADVVLVLDASLSMLEPSVPGSNQTKIDAARKAAQEFLTALHFDQGDQAAIVTFNSQAILLHALTNDPAVLDVALASIETSAQTCIVCGVELGTLELVSTRHRLDNKPVLILLTDGRSNPRPVSAAVEEAERSKALGIQIFTIGLGADLDEEALREMASGPNGYFHAPSGAELAQIYREIAVNIPCPASAFWAGR